MLVKELARQFEEIADDRFLEDKASELSLPDSYIKRIRDCINYWINQITIFF